MQELPFDRGLFEFVSVLNMILWIWFPLPIVDEWIISPNIWVGILIGMIILLPCLIIMYVGVREMREPRH